MFSSQSGGFATALKKDYATESDFSRLFEEKMNRFYFLSLLLTGDEQKAELCLVRGLELCRQSTSVFREWAQRWAIHSILKSAIAIVAPINDGHLLSSVLPDHETKSEPEMTISALKAVPAFDRFVFVMSALEKYSDRECATFLGCSPREIPVVRTRAFRQLGKNAELLQQQWMNEPLPLRKIS